MDFDPLSLFTPAPVVDVEENTVQYTPLSTADSDDAQNVIPSEQCSQLDLEFDLDQPVHFLDLPLLQLNPPDNVLLLFLKLLAPDQVHNFSKETTSSAGVPSDTFTVKDVEALVPLAMPWLFKFCPRFNSAEKLKYLPSLAGPLKGLSPYNSWLTKIISSTASDEVLKQASLRISENCGRTAQPEIIRKITITELERFGKNHVSLREPSLTSDNLGLKTWGSSLILSSRLVKSTTSERKSPYLLEPILELGSGTGLVGIICSLMGYDTMLTDLKEIVPNLQANIDLNELEDSGRGRAKVEELDWTNPNPFIDRDPLRRNLYKTVILSDPIYLAQHPYWVVDMVQEFLSRDPEARVLVQIPLRPKYEQERALLWRLLDESGFEVLEEAIEEGYDDFGEMKFNFKQLRRRICQS